MTSTAKRLLARFNQWTRLRSWRSHERQHRRESGQRDNQRLRQSYAKYPVKLLGVATADVFLGDDIRRLAAHVLPLLRDDGLGARERGEVDDFLRRARSAVGGSGSLAPIRFVQRGEKLDLFGRSQPMPLPIGIRTADLFLAHLPSALVTAAIVATFRGDPVADLFAADHEAAVVVRKHTISYGMVEEAKQTAFARTLASAADTGLLPTGIGLLRAHRYPRGALLIWSLPAMPQDDLEWRDVARVLGIETWNRWDAPNKRLLVGVPEKDGRVFEGEGLSLLLTAASDGAEHAHDLAPLYDELRDWLPWVTVMQSAFQVTDDAGALRQDLDRARLGGKGLDVLVARLHERQYQLSRMKQAARDVGDGRRIGFPDLILYDPRVQSAAARKPAKVAGGDAAEATASKDASTPPRQTLREGVMWAIGHNLDEGFEEVELSLQRARMLAELTTGRSVRIWTRVVGALTVVLCVLTLVLVYEAVQGPRPAPAPGSTTSPSVQQSARR